MNSSARRPRPGASRLLSTRLACAPFAPGEAGKAAADRLEANKVRYGAIVNATGMKVD